MAKKYSEVEVEKGMIAAATLGIRPAGKRLGIPHETIWGWIQAQPERYAEIKAEEAPKWRAKAAAGFEDVVDELTEMERRALTRLDAQIDRVEAKDLARTVKDLATAKGINSQHIHQLRDRPAQVIEHRVSMPAIEKGLEALSVLDAVEGTATEEKPLLDSGGGNTALDI